MTPAAAKWVTRIVIGRLRVGVRDPTVLDALSLAKAGDKSLRPPLERAYNLSSDIGLVAETLYRGGPEALGGIVVRVGNPVNMALAERADGVEEILRRLGRCSVEPKYDGFRCQVHKNGDEVTIFSRGLENMTGMFPEIADAARRDLSAGQAIIEGEAMAYNAETGKYYPFQETTKRRRIYNIAEMSAQLPLRLVAFDLLLAEGEDLTGRPYEERRTRLERLITPSLGLRVTDALFTEDPEEMALFYDDSVGEGLEGIVAKKLTRALPGGQARLQLDQAEARLPDGAARHGGCGRGGLLLRARGARRLGHRLAAVRRLRPREGHLPHGDALRQRAQQSGLDGARAAAGAGPYRAPRPARGEHPHARRLGVAALRVRAPGRRGDTQPDAPGRGATEGGSGYALRFPRIIQEREKQPEDATSVTEVLDLYRMQGHKGESGKRAARGRRPAEAAPEEA